MGKGGPSRAEVEVEGAFQWRRAGTRRADSVADPVPSAVPVTSLISGASVPPASGPPWIYKAWLAAAQARLPLPRGPRQLQLGFCSENPASQEGTESRFRVC